MFSFKSLAVVATLAFGAISSVVAAPLTSESNNVLARCGCDGAAGIVTDLTASVAVYTQKLRGLAAAECTIDTLTPIVVDLKGVIVDATVKVNALVGADADIIMATVDGTAQITVAALAQLVATLAIDIFGAIGVVINLGGVVALSAVISLLATIGEIFGCFLCCLLSVTAGVAVNLGASIVALISVDILATITRLNVVMIGVALGIKI